MVEKNESDDDDEFDLWASLEEMGMCIARKEGTLARSLRPKYTSFMVILQSSNITHDAVVSCLLLLFFFPPIKCDNKY